MKKITLALLSVLLITALGGCKSTTPQTADKNVKPALMWFDAEANFERFSYPDSIDYYLTKIKSLGFTHAVVDVRPITGEVLFDTEFAPKMREWQGYERKDFDYLGHFIKKAHELGIEVHASLNVFVAGHNYFDRGLVYSTHPEWASVVYTPEGMTSITNEKKKYSAMVNPINEDFRTHILNVLKDLVKRYPDLDGLMLDRVRYDGISADFSDISRQQFEAYVGQKVEKFPEDIFEWKKDSNGKYYPERGKYDPSKDFDWATPEYKNYGYAELIDLYATGNYYTDITIEESLKNKKTVWNETDSQGQSGTWYSVEGSCQKLRHIMKDNQFMGGILVDQFYDNPAKLSATIEMNLKASDGLMVFDIVHIINKGLWKEVENGMRAGGALK